MGSGFSLDPLADAHGRNGGGFDGNVVQVVDPSEVRPVTNITEINNVTLDPFEQLPRRHWRRRRPPFWRENAFGFPISPFGPSAAGFGRNPFSGPTAEQNNNPDVHSNTHLHKHERVPSVQPITSGPQTIGSSLLQTLGIPNMNRNIPDSNPTNKRNWLNSKSSNSAPTEMLTQALKQNLQDPKTINQLSEAVLQAVAGKVVTNLVDKLVDKVSGSLNPSVSLPGFAQNQAGRGFGQPNIPVTHTQGANSATVIPVLDRGGPVHLSPIASGAHSQEPNSAAIVPVIDHGDHVHLPQGTSGIHSEGANSAAVVPIIDHGDHIHLPQGAVLPVVNRNSQTTRVPSRWNGNIRPWVNFGMRRRNPFFAIG